MDLMSIKEKEDGGGGGVGRSKKKGLIFRAWNRYCKSLGGGMKRSKSWPSGNRVAPEGSFWVYVGEEKQKFCIKTQCLNHPLFKILLEEAESEYGFTIDGPLELPCEVGLFIKVLMEMDCDDVKDGGSRRRRCASFSPRSSTSYHHLPSPRSMLAFNKVH
ncbi:OLC1v1028557C1 [Oldenlandia corymbosa var. corymbosa]|uniref:OLC1v1028557C1 n=1 Tax=Oldenlandia corymbosa var. corymbosa TaxID=529605 RepID=A0AAV1CC93_OLDCO|nr:OLC1v1028557C1 [Oldenlandia corymbosa var. corymbosa]